MSSYLRNCLDRGDSRSAQVAYWLTEPAVSKAVASVRGIRRFPVNGWSVDVNCWKSPGYTLGPVGCMGMLIIPPPTSWKYAVKVSNVGVDGTVIVCVCAPPSLQLTNTHEFHPSQYWIGEIALKTI